MLPYFLFNYYQYYLLSLLLLSLISFHYFLYNYYSINITFCNKVYSLNFSFVPVVHVNLPDHLFKGSQWKRSYTVSLCYSCHHISFTIYLTLSLVLIKRLFKRSCVEFYLLSIILCGGERYLLTYFVNSPETLRKLCVSAKCPHLGIR